MTRAFDSGGSRESIKKLGVTLPRDHPAAANPDTSVGTPFQVPDGIVNLMGISAQSADEVGR